MFSHDLERLFIVTQSGKTRMAQVTVWRPLGELDLRHYQRL